MKLILKKNLDHQNEPVNRITEVLRDSVYPPRKSIENPRIDVHTHDIFDKIKEYQHNIKVQDRKITVPLNEILNIDIKMETGTGKTYVFSKTIYELNKRYGLKKFIIVVPSLAIKAGTDQFLTNSYNLNHFTNTCGYKGNIKIHSVESTKKKKKSKQYMPSGIKEFVMSSSVQENDIQVLLINMQHLKENKNGVLVRNDYDSKIEGFNTPIDAIAATKPIVIIDEPHRFDRGNATYRFIEERIKPQLIIRYGATFPYLSNQSKNTKPVRDYLNLVYDLNTQEAFKKNLIKGISKEHVKNLGNDEVKFKVLSLKKGESVRFQKTYLDSENNVKTDVEELKVGDSLTLLSSKMFGMSIESIAASKITLNNGIEKVKGDIFYADTYATSYTRESIKLALKRHFETERLNFNRKFKIKTLALFFIDDIYSYREKGSKEPYLKNIFEDELQKSLIEEIAKCNKSEKEYKNYLEVSLQNVGMTHVGYFSQDNLAKEEEIEKEVKTILFGKEQLISFRNSDNTLNTTRFIFSKWTLREGWDNPNIFTIAKLRSSGSDNSKMQEVGRGLRLPVDETGNRIDHESFMLNYIVDFTEKNFVKSLETEIYGDQILEDMKLTQQQIGHISKQLELEENQVVIRLLSKDYINYTLDINMDKYNELIEEFPDIFDSIGKGKIIDRNKTNLPMVAIRKDNYKRLQSLWEKLNEKYYIELADINDKAIVNHLFKVITEDLSTNSISIIEREKLENVQGELKFTKTYESLSSTVEPSLSYSEFLKMLTKITNIPMKLIHRTLIMVNNENPINKEFFSKQTILNISHYLKQRIYQELIKVYSYKKIENIDIHPTQLTNLDGSPKDYIETTAYLGNNFSDGKPKENYLYDKILYDSEIEKENIISNVENIEVFAKIPRKTLKIPFIDGSTYSPDFMYVVNKKDSVDSLNLVVESKGVDRHQDVREIENDKIAAATKLFETASNEGIKVNFVKQINSQKIFDIIQRLIDK